MRHQRLNHLFVQHIPRTLEPGVLYISIEYATAAHVCCCGCGEEVVTPFTPTDWSLTFDGETISLWPSIGNWNFVCRSHYVIECSQVIEARPWSTKRIITARFEDKAAKASYFGAIEGPDRPIADKPE
jgi:hypothetical protein